MPYHLLVIITVFILIWLPASHASSSLTTECTSDIEDCSGTYKQTLSSMATTSVTYSHIPPSAAIVSPSVSPLPSNDDDGGSTEIVLNVFYGVLAVISVIVGFALLLGISELIHKCTTRHNIVHPDPAGERERSRHHGTPSPPVSDDTTVSIPTHSRSLTEYLRSALVTVGLVSSQRSPVRTGRQQRRGGYFRSLSTSSVTRYIQRSFGRPPPYEEQNPLEEIQGSPADQSPPPEYLPPHESTTEEMPDAGTRRRSSRRSSQVEETDFTRRDSIDEAAPGPIDDVLVLEDIED